MPVDTALLVGFLFGSAVYLILSGSFVRILFGFLLLSNAANLLVLAVSGDPAGRTPPLADIAGPHVDPLPQALILTAIVIGFGTTVYLIFLLYRYFLDFRTTRRDGKTGGRTL